MAMWIQEQGLCQIKKEKKRKRGSLGISRKYKLHPLEFSDEIPEAILNRCLWTYKKAAVITGRQEEFCKNRFVPV